MNINKKTVNAPDAIPAQICASVQEFF